MKSRLRYRCMMICFVIAFISFSSISSFADTIKYQYDDVNRVMRVETGGGTAVITASAGSYSL
jgi:hypothetical protein